MTRICVGLAVAALVVLSAAPAFAKVEIKATDATILGPGLDEPIDLGPGEATGLLEKTRGFDALYGAALGGTVEPHGDLGPRFTVTYRVEAVDHASPGTSDRGELVQYLYPFAEDGPLLHYPSGQESPNEMAPAIGSGWLEVDGFTLSHFRFYGLPRAPDGPPARGGGGLDGTVVLVALVAIAAAGLLALVGPWSAAASARATH